MNVDNEKGAASIFNRCSTFQTVDKVPDKSPGFSFIMFSTFLTFFHRFTKKNVSVINFIFQGFASTS